MLPTLLLYQPVVYIEADTLYVAVNLCTQPHAAVIGSGHFHLLGPAVVGNDLHRMGSGSGHHKFGIPAAACFAHCHTAVALTAVIIDFVRRSR